MNRALGALLLGALLAAAGCSSSTGTGQPKVKVGGDDQGAGDKQAPGKPDAPEFVGNFLKAVGEGKVTAAAEMLTDDFKRTIARPRPGIDEDKMRGYNLGAVESFLRKAGEGKLDTMVSGGKVGSGHFFVGHVVSGAGKSEKLLIRLVPADTEAGWKVDWFHRTTAKGPQATEGSAPPEATLAAHQFLENLLGGDPALAEAVLAHSWKVREYGSKNPSDADLGYNRALVLLKLRDWKGPFTEFTIAKREAAAFEGELIDPATKQTKAYVLRVGQEKAGADRGDRWYVVDFEVK